MKDLYVKAPTITSDTDTWVLVFREGNDSNIAIATKPITFTQGSGEDVGDVTISFDGIVFQPILYPLTLAVGTYWFKRSDSTKLGAYNLIE